MTTEAGRLAAYNPGAEFVVLKTLRSVVLSSLLPIEIMSNFPDPQQSLDCMSSMLTDNQPKFAINEPVHIQVGMLKMRGEVKEHHIEQEQFIYTIKLDYNRAYRVVPETEVRHLDG